MARPVPYLFMATFAVLISCSRAHAQNILGEPKFEYGSKAPEVALMQKFIDIPVSYFTGTANISIPVYTVSQKGISVPITLDYHSGGIPADAKPTTTGLGWLLTIGGSITRNIKGSPDEGINRAITPYIKIPNPPLSPPGYTYRWASTTDSLADALHREGGYYADYGFPWDRASLKTAVEDHNQAIRDGSTPPNILRDFMNGVLDSEPDQFYFSFGGYSGKFVFDQNRGIILQPYRQDLRITPIYKRRIETEITPGAASVMDTAIYSQYYFESFIISTPDAKDYFFGETPASRLESALGNNFKVYNAWMLTKVVDRNTKDSITISYLPSTTIYTAIRNVQKFVKPSDVSTACVNTANITQLSQSSTQLIVDKILSDREELNFFYSNGKLDSIFLKNIAVNELVRKMQFDYSTFQSGRTKLLGFLTKDLKKNEFSPYSLKYYDTAGYAGPTAQDYWGYHNGAANGSKLLPSYPGCTTSGADRTPAWPAMKIDALIEVDNPTGGYSKLEYEPHTAWSGRRPDDAIVDGDAYFAGNYTSFSLSGIIGGLRVKSIENYDPVAKDTLFKQLYYKRFGTEISSGHLYIPPTLSLDISSFVCNTGVTNNRPLYYISTHNLYHGTGSESHVSYKNVTVAEKRRGVSNGYTEYEFYDDTNTDSSFYANAISQTANLPLTSQYDVYPAWQFKRLPQNYLNGSEKEKRIYNAAGELLQRERTIYKSRIINNFSTGGVLNSVLYQDICDPASSSPPAGGSNINSRRARLLAPASSYYFFNSYRIQNIAILQYQKISEHYASLVSKSTDTVTYFYDNVNHVSSTATETKNSKKELIRNETWYAFDFNDVNNGDSIFYFMKQAFVNEPVATFTFNNGKVVKGGYRLYEMRSPRTNPGFLPSQEFRMFVNPAGILPSALNISSAYPKSPAFTPGAFQRVITSKYNPDNTISYVTRKSGEKISFLWDYNRNNMVA